MNAPVIAQQSMEELGIAIVCFVMITVFVLCMFQNYFKVIMCLVGECITSITKYLIVQFKKHKRRINIMPIERINAKQAGISNDQINKRDTSKGPDMALLQAAELENHGVPLYDHSAPVRLRGISQPTINNQPQQLQPHIQDDAEKMAAHVHRATPISITEKPSEPVKEEILGPPEDFTDLTKHSGDTTAEEPVELPDNYPVGSATTEETTNASSFDKPGISKDSSSTDITSILRRNLSEVAMLDIFDTLYTANETMTKELINEILKTGDNDGRAWMYKIIAHSKIIQLDDPALINAYNISKQSGVDIDTVLIVLRCMKDI